MTLPDAQYPSTHNHEVQPQPAVRSNPAQPPARTGNSSRQTGNEAAKRFAGRPPFGLYRDSGAAPTAFVRSALFADKTPTPQLFRVLGIKNVTVERDEYPLTETHLLTLAYLVGQVHAYDDKLGVTVTFAPWDAVRTLQWTRSTQSISRLAAAIEALARTTVRIVEENGASQEAAPLVARRTTSGRNQWEVQLTATLLVAVQRFHTFVDFDKVRRLPNGAATALYLFIYSERAQKTEWPMAELATIAGLSSANERHIKQTLEQALEILTTGIHFVKARGASLRKNPKARSVMLEDDRVVYRATEETRVLQAFEPVLEEYAFRRDRRGHWRIALTKVVRTTSWKTISGAEAGDGPTNS